MKKSLRSVILCFLVLSQVLSQDFLLTKPAAVKSKTAALEPDFQGLYKRFAKNIKRYTLSNGIRVILMKNGVTPTAACYLKIGVGASDEPFDQAGTAHFLEHLLFKGTKKVGTKDFSREEIYLRQIAVVGERIDKNRLVLLDPLLPGQKKKKLKAKIKKDQILLKSLEHLSRKFMINEEDARIYSLAGEVGYNAYTSSDVTNYQIQLPNNRLELWAWLESSRLLEPVLRSFYTEREVIQEERKMRYDSKPSSLLYELFLKTAFGLSPYGKPVIGFSNNIPRLKLKDTKEFFKTRYIPSKMVIAIVGDIQFKSTIKILKKYFERLPSRKSAEFPPIQYENPKGRKTAELRAEHTPYLITGWYKPSIFHKDHLTFEVLADLFTGGINSRLVKRLVVQEKLVQSIRYYAGIPGEKLENLHAFFITPYAQESYPKILAIINEEILKLKEKGPTKQELKRVKTKQYASLISSLESNAGLADSLSYYELMLNDYKTFFKYMTRLNQIKTKDIQAALDAYFKDENNITVSIKKP